MTTIEHARFADIGTATTGALTLAAWLSSAEIYLRVGATLVAIIAGTCASLYHFEAWRQKRRDRDL